MCFLTEDEIELNKKKERYDVLTLFLSFYVHMSFRKLLLFVLVFFIFNSSIIESKIFDVSDYGAYANDHIDDTHAIQAAINAAIYSGLNDTISFGYGTYVLSSSINVTNATNLIITGQGAQQTLLLGINPTTIFIIMSGENITIRSLSIDFDPLPFTGGFAINVTDTYIDLKVQPPHRINPEFQIASLLRFDANEMRIAFGPQTYFFYPSGPMNTSQISTDIIRIYLTSSTEFNVGDGILARYSELHRAIYASTVTDLTIQSINIYTSWFMGIVTNRIIGLNIFNVQIAPPNGRWASTLLDCMNFANGRGYINIYDSRCELTSDDGLNVHEPYVVISDVINSTTVMTQVMNGTDVYFFAGMRVEFSSNSKPFTVYQTATVAEWVPTGPYSRLLTLTVPINVSVGDYVANADPPMLTIRNFTVERNRAHGILLETRNVDVRNCVFNRTSGPAVLFQPSKFWNEGVAGQNVTLANNLYINCNEGIGRDHGVIAITLQPTQFEPVMKNIRIESSTFYFGNYSRGLLLSRSAANVRIEGNYLATNNSEPLIIICNSRNITASNNTLISNQIGHEQYYAFDTLVSCAKNLSSLIDLPASAFNSSFPPPVIA